MTTDRETPDEARARNRRRLATEGVDTAVEAALGLLRDPKATAAAKASTINSVLRAAGMFSDAGDEGDVDPSEMDGEQLHRYAARAIRDFKARLAAGEVHEPEEVDPAQPAPQGRKRAKPDGWFG